jgi:hypothetical protein
MRDQDLTGTLKMFILILAGSYVLARLCLLPMGGDEPISMGGILRHDLTTQGQCPDVHSQWLNVQLASLSYVKEYPLPSIRVPALCGFALFLWGLWRLQRTMTQLTGLYFLVAVLSSAFLLDYFGLCRGYGLAMGFLCLAWSYFNRPWQCFLLLTLCLLSHLGFLIIVIPTVIVFCWEHRKRTVFPLIAFTVVICVFILTHVKLDQNTGKDLKKRGYGTPTGFLKASWRGIAGGLFYYED